MEEYRRIPFPVLFVLIFLIPSFILTKKKCIPLKNKYTYRYTRPSNFFIFIYLCQVFRYEYCTYRKKKRKFHKYDRFEKKNTAVGYVNVYRKISKQHRVRRPWPTAKVVSQSAAVTLWIGLVKHGYQTWLSTILCYDIVIILSCTRDWSRILFKFVSNTHRNTRN